MKKSELRDLIREIIKEQMMKTSMPAPTPMVKKPAPPAGAMGRAKMAPKRIRKSKKHMALTKAARKKPAAMKKTMGMKKPMGRTMGRR